MVELTADLLDAVTELLVAATARRAGLAGRDLDPSDHWAVGLRRAARAVVEPALHDADRFCLVALARSAGTGPGDGGRDPVGVLTGLVTRLTPEDAGYTYLPPRHTLVPLSGWATREGYDPGVLRALWEQARSHSTGLGLDRLTVQVLDADRPAVGHWRTLGLRPDTAFACRPTTAPGPITSTPLTIRPARTADLEAVVDLALEEQVYHALHTGSGMAADQRRDTVTAVCTDWLDPDAPEETERAFVAEAPDGTVVGVTTVHTLSVPDTVLSAHLLPRRHGYIGLTSVTASWRGHGVGTALAGRALDWVRALPDPPDFTGLHYVTDNVTSAPFWRGLGFASIITHLTDAPPHHPTSTAPTRRTP